jgi:signal transduction histidine kinase
MRFLLVEDEPDLGAAIKRTLTQKAYIVDRAQDGLEAWYYLDSQWTQHTPVGGRVTLILDSAAGHALIQVQDTGTRIAPSEQAPIFDRFCRVNSDRSRHTGGAGLGLPIALAIATAHGGSIAVASVEGIGSQFTIELPSP